MIKNRPLGHIGLGTNDIEATVNYYIDVLGFELIGSFKSPVDEPIQFIKNGDIVYEVYTPNGGVDAPGKIDHICFVSEDIEADYRYCAAQGYKLCTDGIQELPTVWDRGVRYFKLESPSGEAIEYCQVL